MPKQFTCPRGHVWDVVPGGGPSALLQGIACPRCGDPALTVPPRAGAGQPSPPPPPGPPPAPEVSVPGYEVLELLGRGGMGVVLKARDVRLKRLVALKMILAGGLAGAQERARFRTEAEAVARLQHPNVVQIHEVGEHDELPFLALEYVEGGTLAGRLAGAPQGAESAARLVEVLARAIHAAHLKGVVHRDLKPANVLLTADGTPKITDFGLAKKLDDDEAHTHTGAVLGTPSYMAPEQAAGRGKHGGPPIDVYALGAVLYELLTGRPPFRGTSVIETLEQVRAQDPVPPSRLRAKVPRDLELICLKCLQKEPARRYASAEQLADELRRFLAREPLRHTRAVGRLERGWRWCRRRPVVAALLAGLAAALAVGTSGILWQWQKARASDARARKAVLDLAEANYSAGALIAPGNYPEAERRFEEALGIVASLARDFPDSPEYQTALAQSWNALGYVRATQRGKQTQGEAAYRNAIELLEELIRKHGSRPSFEVALSTSRGNLGELLISAGRPEEAQPYLRRAADALERLTAGDPGNLVYWHRLASVHTDLALLAAGTPGAESEYRRAIATQQRAVALAPAVPLARDRLARLFNDLGASLDATARPAEAEEAYRQATTLLEKLVADAPSAEYRSHLVQSRGNLAHLLLLANRQAEAEEQCRACAKDAEALAEEFPADPQYQAHAGKALAGLAYNLTTQGEWREARVVLQRALRHQRAAIHAEPGNGQFRQIFETQYWSLAGAHLQLGDYQEAARLAQKTAPELADTAAVAYDAACVLARAAGAADKDEQLTPTARQQRARAYADQAVERLREAIKKGYKDVGHMKADVDLTPLRQRPDYRALLRDLER